MKTNTHILSYLPQFFLESEIFRTKIVDNIKMYILCSVTFFFFENPAVYEMWEKNIVELGRTQLTIWRTRMACWIPKATNTHSECVILITFPLKHWLHERASMLRYTYIACLVVPLCLSLNMFALTDNYI
jgi:hypothetical protein